MAKLFSRLVPGISELYTAGEMSAGLADALC